MIDEKIKNKLLQELEKSGNVYFACLKNNIHRSTYYRWKEEDADFKSKAEEAEHRGRENSCDMAEWALMANVKEKKMDAIKYQLGHNSSRYKNKEPTNVVIFHRREPSLKEEKEAKTINLTQVFQKIFKDAEEKEKAEQKESQPETIPQVEPEPEPTETGAG